jgi:methionine aminopeptidase
VQAAGDIVNDVMKKLIALCVEGAKIIDLCIQGDKFIEEGTGGVYNKPVKGVKTSKGASYIVCGFERDVYDF